MNLRKDHYRSFTRTLCIVVVLSFVGVGCPQSDCGILRHAPCFGRLVWRLLRRLFVVSAHPPESAPCVRSPVSHKYTTLVDGYLGMNNDEERSEMRYVVRIAEFSESSKL